MDNQDLEEYFMTCSPLTVTYTEDRQIIDLQTPNEKQNAPEQITSDDELSSVMIDIPEVHTQTPEVHTQTPESNIPSTEPTGIMQSPKRH